MNDDDFERDDDERRPRSRPTRPLWHPKPPVRADAPTGPSDVEAAGAPARPEVPWVRPSELPMAVVAPVLGKVVDRSLAAQSRATRPVVLAPAVVACAATRRLQARRAARRSKGLDR